MKQAKEVRMSRFKSARNAQRAQRIEPHNNWLHLTARLQTFALALCASTGCSSVGGSHLLNNSFHKPQSAAAAPVAISLRDSVTTQTPANQSAVPLRTAAQPYNTAQSYNTAQPYCAVAPRFAAGPQSEVVTVSHQEPATASDSAYAVASDPTPYATTVSYQVAKGCSPTCGAGCNCGAGSEGNCAPVEGQNILDVQEYIFDGGDLDPALLVRKDNSIAGLNPTDTVAYYETYDGRLCITPTNRVPIYAPRFGAVRQVTGVVLSEHALATERILAPVAPSRFEDKNLVSSMVQPVAAQGEDKVSLIDAFRDRNGGVPIAQVIPPQRMSDAIVPFEAIDFFRTGVLKYEDIAVLGQFFQNAKAWETPESLAVLVEGQEASIVRDTKQPQDVHVYDLPPGKCSLRICKAASHMIANSGDQITFTIRFDNIGAQPIEKVVILDSLSPRLEYIQESQQSSVAPAPEFSAEPNDVGSTVLKWEFKSSLKPGAGGVLHFRCLVR